MPQPVATQPEENHSISFRQATSAVSLQDSYDCSAGKTPDKQLPRSNNPIHYTYYTYYHDIFAITALWATTFPLHGQKDKYEKKLFEMRCATALKLQWG